MADKRWENGTGALALFTYSMTSYYTYRPC